ncbi:molecular chaperone GrpE (heat shock protein) [Parabacteroides sp. PF5-5]|uniref:hypothetical protein n=1 Tax=unclassified Parabacteroides TaxID=2649774 RepID=UPI002473545B|nr:MULTISPECIES: hypothetical protein [unclassified Parabacteroides]MDH6303907.1 molecular chaperone GrpE (heat shock protein) [Parabacteroides sp. PH5-39]MDH6314524.1 molecular chaperone GrpE (heat shock protein) [Parabacteroides sp. PF5-13]MDH6318411.1 molecular chaperone GrpE (heat shock protein) [Parabacteroides sp. PH5-13]MDH6322296.1 molecular chaperone GrpE (heat shock protein) [Parabacteroides sp. PH5-8]MDH6325624.1 molecular chaperone GrpE (heat shock protein) [Parabacteroides sp. PH5
MNINNSKKNILCLLALFVSIVGAKGQLPPINTVDTSLVAVFRKIESLEQSIIQRRNALEENTRFKDKQRVDSLELSIAEQDNIIFHLKEELLSKYTDNETLKKRLASLEIYEFLGRRDVFIFIEDFKIFEIGKTSLCHQNHYFLIKNIQSVNNILSQIEIKISKENISNIVQNSSTKTEETKDFLIQSAKKDLLNADKIMIEIDEMDKSILSPEQQQFYEQTLTNKYRTIYNQIYPNEISDE